MRASTVSAPTCSARTLKASPLVDRPGEDLVARAFAHRYRFATDHAFVHVRGALVHGTVHRDALAGAHADAVAHPDHADGQVFFPIRGNDACGFGLQAHQFADGRRGVAFRAFFQQFPQQNEGNDHARSFVVHVYRHAGGGQQRRKQRVDQTVQESHRYAQCHQRVHVGRTVACLPDGIDKETPPEVQDRQGQHQHHPSGVGVVHEDHRDDHQRDGQGPGSEGAQADPAVAFGLFFLFFFFGIVASDEDVVPDGADLPLDFLQGDHRAVIDQVHVVRGEVDIGLEYAGQGARGVFHIGGADGAAHFQHRDDGFLYVAFCHRRFESRPPCAREVRVKVHKFCHCCQESGACDCDRNCCRKREKPGKSGK